jgi:uroporphyrinogen-III synthase
VEGLTAQGRSVSAVQVYQWKLPVDTGPLAESITKLLSGDVDVAIFTTSVQVEHLLQFAEQQGRREAVVEALQRTYIASIGPTCTESLKGEGLAPKMEPSHPKMGILVREAALAFSAVRRA